MVSAHSLVYLLIYLHTFLAAHPMTHLSAYLLAVSFDPPAYIPT